jgi:predicted nucleic acid-binding protein
MKILVDSSVWIDYFKSGKNSDLLDQFIEENLICTCGLILAELIPSITLKNEKKLLELLLTIHSVKCNPDWERIIHYQIECKKNGINKVGIPDLIILQTVIDSKVKLYTLDKHFALIRNIIPFDLIQ